MAVCISSIPGNLQPLTLGLFVMCLATKAFRTGKSLPSSEKGSLTFWGCSGSVWLHFSHSCLRNSLASVSSYQGSSAPFCPVSSWNLYWHGEVNGLSFHIFFAQCCLPVWQVLAKFSFRLFTQYLLNKRVMVISGSSQQSLCTAILLWKWRSHLPQCMLIILLADVTHQDGPFVSDLVLWNSTL